MVGTENCANKLGVVNNSFITNNWRWLNTLLLFQIYNRSSFLLCSNGHSGWDFGISNVGHSQQPFFWTFWLGFSGKACVDFEASLRKALKFIGCCCLSYSNTIGLLVTMLRQSIVSVQVIGSNLGLVIVARETLLR